MNNGSQLNLHSPPFYGTSMNLNPLFTCTLQKNRFLQREQQQKEIAAVTQEKFLKAPVYYPSTEAETLHG